MKYRLKTHDELLNSGFVLTPSGEYLHSRFEKITPEMIEYATKFSPELIKVLFDASERLGFASAKFIDVGNYTCEHFVCEPLLMLA